MSSVRAARTRRPAARWATRAVLALAILAQLFACQALLITPGPVPPAMIQDIGHGVGHDVDCEVGSAPTTAGVARAVAPVCLPPVDPAGALLALIATGLLAVRITSDGAPSWAPRRPLPGRRRLLAVGITRV